MKTVILAGGLGTRLKPLTQVIPKPLLPVGERSILEITVERLKSCTCRDIIMATNYKSHLFESYFGDGSRWGIKISYSKETMPLGTAGPLKLLKNEFKEPFLVINGDILTNLDFRKLKEYHMDNSADLTLVAKELKTPLHYGVVKSRGKSVLGLEEKPVIESEINAGIYFLSPSVIKFIPENKLYNMTDLIRRLIKERRKVVKYVLKDYWLDIGQIEDYRKAQTDIKKDYLK